MNVKARTLPNGPLEAEAPRVVVLGDIAVDMVMGPLSEWPRIGTETLMPRSDMRAGGSAGNTVLALQGLNAPVRLLSAVGHDALGLWLRSQFAGIDADIVMCNAPTSVSVGILHSCGERNFFTVAGHLAEQDWGPLAGKLLPARPGAIALLTGAFLLPRLRAHYPHIIGHLHALGYQVAIDTGWPPQGWTDGVITEVRQWLALADHILLNELEITSLTGIADIEIAMIALASTLKADATLVAKVGRKGAVALRGGARADAAPPPAETIFDTIGAGDAFNAGYLHSISRGESLVEALRTGCETATRIIAQFPRQPAQQHQSEGA